MGNYPFDVYGRATLDDDAWEEQQARIAAYDAGRAYEPRAPDPEPVPTPELDETPPDPKDQLQITDLSVEKARKVISLARTIDFLESLRAQEEANPRPDGARTSVLGSIARKIAELERKFT